MVFLGILAVLLMVGPSGNYWAFSSSTPSSPAAAPTLTAGTTTSNSTAVTSAASGSIPGQSPAGESVINAASLVSKLAASPAEPYLLRQADNETTALSNTTAVSKPTYHPAGTTVPAASTSASLSSASTSSAYGWIEGTVVEAGIAQTPLSGALVSAEPVTGFCPPAGCAAVQTGATGTFTVQASIGENEVIVSDGFYLSNRTWTYVSTGAYDNVGTIDMVAEGLVTGVVEGSDPAHEAVPGIGVSSLSIDGAVQGSPSTHTNALGQFTVAVPPVPSEIDFSPILPNSVYESNITFVNVTSGGTLNIGTVYLQRSTIVSYHLVDSVTGQNITQPAALQICSRITGYCPSQGETNYGPDITAFAPVGPDTVQVLANDYVLDTTVLGVVPATRPGADVIPMGNISLVPIGEFAVWPNITGVSQPYGDSIPTSEWDVGEYTIVSSCNLDGLSYSYYNPTTGNMSFNDCTSECVQPGSEGFVPAIPLRNFVRVQPDEVGCLQPGYPTWPIPGDLPVTENYGWVNITPDRVTDAGGIDLLPGTYIEGTVFPASQTGWDVTVCSTDEANECSEGVYADQQYYGSYTFFVPTGCPQTETAAAYYTFCAPAPPGPVELRVTPTNASANFTWAYNPPLQWNYLPLPLSRADQDYSDSIDIGSARVTGTVLQSLSLTPVLGLPSIQVCPAGAIPSAVVCGGTVANSTGTFSVSAPLGWDSVTVSAPDYEPNTTWVYVEGNSTSAGIILLVPYGYVEGQVVDSSGVGIFEATVDLCAAVSPNSCQAIGSDGLTSTDGFYYGATPAGPPPVEAYEIKASAPGYVTDWTWVNVTTPGENFTAPTIVLQSVAGSSGSEPAREDGARTPDAASNSTIGAWLEGTIIDSSGGYGLPTASITANPTTGATPVVLSSIRGTGGEFNSSLPTGTYSLSIAASGFYSRSLYLNVSGNQSVLNLGTIQLVPYPTITGQLVIAPAAWTAEVTYGMGLGPGQGQVHICTAEATACGPGGIVATSGYFNASAPAGDYDLVQAGGTGAGIGTFTGGFISGRTIVNVTNSSQSGAIPEPIGLSIFGIVTGSVINANSTSDATKPVRYDQVTADTTFPIDATQNEVMTADGTYAIVFPESNGLNMTAGGLGSWIPVGVGITVNGSSQGGSGKFLLEAGQTIVLDPISVEHYGWVDLEVTSGLDGTPIPYATVAASTTGTLWTLPTSFSASGVANGAGFLNLSVPPSIPTFRTKVALTISAPDFGTAWANVSVNASKTTYVNGSTALDLNGIALSSWGWFFGSVKDPTTGNSLSGADVAVSVGGLPAGKTGVESNGLGQFVTVAPPGKQVNLTISLLGYTSNRTTWNVSYNEQLTPAAFELEGDGLVAGRIVSEPGDVPVAGATVSVCPEKQPNCESSVVTNDSGIFWVAATPGQSAVTVGAPGFVTNTSAYVNVASDRWSWIGDVAVQRYAYVTGTVLGLPSGLPLAAAIVGACAPTPSGIGAGACVSSATTLPDGSFDLQVAAGTYVLNASAPGYNATFLPIGLVPGQSLSVGLLFVEQYGTATGLVLAQGSGSAIPGAAVIACQDWGAHACEAPTVTHTGGSFLITEPAGPIQLQAVADGYQSSFRTVWLTPGETLDLADWYLAPTGPDEQYLLTGSVVSGNATGPPVTGAVITAIGSSSAPTNAQGEYAVLLTWGTYQISVTAPGFITQTRSVTIDQNVTVVDFVLLATTYAVHGTVKAGLTDAPIAGANLTVGGVVLGVTSANGSFSISLTNGSHSITITAAAPYVAQTLVVDVIGASVSEPVLLYPPAVTLNGAVVNALSGLAVPSATVTVSGTTDEGSVFNLSLSSGPAGRFQAIAYPGAYTVRVTESGYAVMQSALVVYASPSTIPLTLDLQPMTAPASGGVGAPVALWAAVGVIGAAAVAGGVAWAALRARPREPRSRKANEAP